MAVIVRHKSTNKDYVLLGTGFGAFKSSRPGLFLGDLFPTEEKGQITMVALCNQQGEIRWAQSEDVTVVSIDGQQPQELL